MPAATLYLKNDVRQKPLKPTKPRRSLAMNATALMAGYCTSGLQFVQLGGEAHTTPVFDPFGCSHKVRRAEATCSVAAPTGLKRDAGFRRTFVPPA